MRHNRRVNRMTILIILCFVLFCTAACAPVPDDATDVYVEFAPNAQGGIDKEAAEKHAAEARMLLQLKQMEAISTAAVEIGQGDPKPLNVSLTLADGAELTDEMENAIKTIIISSLTGTTEDSVTVTVEGQ